MMWFIRMTFTIVSLFVLGVGCYRSDLAIILFSLIFVVASIFFNGRWSTKGIQARQLKELEKLNRRSYADAKKRN